MNYAVLLIYISVLFLHITVLYLNSLYTWLLSDFLYLLCIFAFSMLYKLQDALRLPWDEYLSDLSILNLI